MERQMPVSNAIQVHLRQNLRVRDSSWAILWTLRYKTGVDEGELVAQKGKIASSAHPAYHASTTRNSASSFCFELM